MNGSNRRRIHKSWLVLACLSFASWGGSAWAALSITPITWNIVGLDSNSPMTGPYQFPVGARVCAVGAASNGAVTATFAFQSGGTNNGEAGCPGGDANPNSPADNADACVFLRADSVPSYQLDGDLTTAGFQAIPSGQCRDAYFEVQVDRNVLAYDRARRYTITAADGSGSVTTPQPRELYIESLVSQNRNSILDVSYSAALAPNAPFPTPLGSMTSVNAGGTFGLAVGGIYDIRLDASTATQGYEQLETFANFSNAVFRILEVETTLSANTSPMIDGGNQPATTDFLYANGCNWQLSPVLPNYLSCQSTGKAGGTVSATYRIQVLSVPGGTTSALNSLIFDYSGSSFHYNADSGIGGRTITIIDPLDSTISKAFVPATINASGVSRLTFTITNPNLAAVTGYGFTDVLPAGLLIATPANVGFSGCTVNPTVTATSGTNTITASGGAAGANSVCTVAVDVTGAALGTYNNGTAPNQQVELLVNGVGTGSFATATLTIGNARPPVPSGNCTSPVTIMSNNFTGVTLANINAAPPTGSMVRHASAPGSMLSFTPKPLNVPNPSVAGTQSINTVQTGSTSGVNSWQGTGFNETNVSSPASFFEISVDSTAFRHILVTAQMRANDGWASNPQRIYVSTSVDGGPFSAITGSPFAFNKNQWVTSGSNFLAPLSGLTTVFRLLPSGTSQAGGPGFSEPFLLDDIVVTGCPYLPPPTIVKSFSPNTIALNATSTLTLTITNPNASALTGVAVSDTLPAGVVIAAGATSNTCGGTLSAPLAGGVVSLTGGTIPGPANTTCTITVPVTGTTSGLKVNTTGPVSSIESGSNTGASGSATANLRVVAPPVLAKSFVNNPVAAGTTSALRFTVTNPNSVYAMSGVGFTDTFPVAPGAMVVATPPGATNGCGGTWSPVAGAGSVTLSGVTLGPGMSCSVVVYVTAPVAGTYNNTSGAVTHLINAVAQPGNTAAASLTANAPVARIGLSKRIGLSPTGPWGEFASTALGDDVYYLFTIENTGDVALNRPASGFWISDSQLGGSLCAGPPLTLTLPTVADTHIYECVVGPVATNQQTLQNNATASGVNAVDGVTTVTSAIDSATYTTKLPDLLVGKTRIAPVGTVDTTSQVDITYRISVLNQGPAATVNGTLSPIIVEDTLRAGLTYLGFTSADPGWSCSLVQAVPLHRVSCSYSNVLAAESATSFDLLVRVAAGTPDVNNTAVALGAGDPECTDASPDPPYTQCKGPHFESTVPVTLSDVRVAVEGNELVVDFGTAAEVGTVGYRIQAGAGQLVASRPLGLGFVEASGAGFEPTRYQLRGAYSGQTRVWIQELAADGAIETFGPFGTNTETGERLLFTPTDWNAIAREQDTFRQAQSADIVRRSSAGETEAELRVSATGLVRVRSEDLLAAGIDWSGQQASELRLARGSTPVPFRYEGPGQIGAGSVVYFLGEEVEDSQYTRTAVYRLKLSTAGSGRTLRTVYSGAGTNAGNSRTAGTYVHNPNRGYDMTSPHSDPWYARRLVRANSPLVGVDEAFVLPDRASDSAAERIEVGMWGGINFPASPDHSVRLLLNGVQISQLRFDGLNYHAETVELPAGVLRTGNNTLRMELVGDTGLFADIVHLDSIKIEYTRELVASADRIAFAGTAQGFAEESTVSDRIFSHDFSSEGVSACKAAEAGCASYVVRGLTRPDVEVYRQRVRGGVEQLTGIHAESVAGGFQLRFAALESQGDRYWVEPVGGRAPQAVAPKAAVVDPLVGAPAEYLVIAHPSFINGLAPLVAARQAEGFTVRVVDVESLYAFYNRGTVDPEAVSAAIADAYQRLGTRYVLLVGGDTYDYFNYTGVNSQSFLPTHYRPTGPIVRFAPVDSPYADVDLDGKPDVAIGRFPIRTQAELQAMVAKTLNYGNAAHAGKLLGISDRTGNDGVNYRLLLTGANRVFGPNTVMSSVSMNDYPANGAGVQAARSAVVNAVNSGQALTVFFGHSAPASWATESLITASLVNGNLFSNAQVPTVAWVLGCYGSYFTHPTYNTVAQALTVQSNGGGAAAILGAAGLTNINSDIAWMSLLRDSLPGERLGDALRDSQRSLTRPDGRYLDISVGGGLLGDPALRLRH